MQLKRMKTTIDSTKISQNIIQFWWVLILGGAIGAIVSYLVSLFFLQPVFVAESKISVSINFKQVGHLTQYEQDQMIGNVSSLFLASETIEETVELLADDEININNFQNYCFLERQVNEILLRCKSDDPLKSQFWSVTWAKISYQKLSDAYTHALEFEKLVSIQDSYETCVEKSILFSPPMIDCQKLLPIGVTLEELDQSINMEQEMSKNIYTGFVFSEVIPAAIPEKPTRYQTNSLVLIGAFFGLILSLIFVSSTNNEK